MASAEILLPGPSIDGLLSAFEKKGGLSAVEQEKVKSATIDELSKPDTRVLAEEHLRGLASSLRSIEFDFKTIAAVLATIDAKKLVKDSAGELHLFGPRWRDIFKAYVELLVKSQKSANKVKFAIKTLLEVVVPVVKNPDLSLEDKKEHLVDYREELNQYQQAETEIIRDLHLLSSDIGVFRAEMRRLLEGSLEVAEQQVIDLENRIELLKQRLIAEDSKGKIRRILDAFKFTFRKDNLKIIKDETDTACAGLAGMLTFIPRIAVKVAVAGMVAVGQVRHNYSVNSTREEIQLAKQRLEQELQEARAKVGEISVAIGKVDALEDNFTSLLSQIGILTQINTMLSMDAQDLELVLERMRVAPRPAALRLSLGLLTSSYGTLYESLTAYVLAAPQAATLK